MSNIVGRGATPTFTWRLRNITYTDISVLWLSIMQSGKIVIDKDLTKTSYTYGTRLYIDGVAYGTENTTWSNHVQNNHLTNVSLTINQKLRVRGRESRNSSYYIYAPTLVIVEN